MKRYKSGDRLSKHDTDDLLEVQGSSFKIKEAGNGVGSGQHSQIPWWEDNP